MRLRLWEGCRERWASTAQPGSIVGGFRVGELLARGAMGAVYLAEDADGRRVALKLLSPELAHDERFRLRFLRESEAGGEARAPERGADAGLGR